MKTSTSTSASQVSRSVFACALALAAGCTASDDVGSESAAILGGAADPTDSAMVGIANLDGQDVCSGVLLAPGLVLAAQRCVAPVVNPGPCAGATFGAARAPDHFFITTKSPMTQMPGDFHEVTEIRVPPGGQAYCGRDFVLLRLISLVGAGEGATPIVPRFDPAVAVAETYASIGYGGTADTGAGGGQRRRLNGLAVACVDATCGSPSIGAGEWKGGASVCPGDQGGPAIDASGKVIGIASRGGAGCVDSIYTAIKPNQDWLIQETVRAAGLGGYPAPAWTSPTPTIDAGVDAPIGPDAGTNPDDDDDGGCSTGGSSHTGAASLLALGLVAARLGRRRARA